MVTIVVKGEGASITSLPTQESRQNNQTSGDPSLVNPLEDQRLGNRLAKSSKSSTNYLIDEISTQPEDALIDWVKAITNNRLPSGNEGRETLLILSTLFHQRHEAFRKAIRNEALPAMRKLLEIVVPVVQNVRKTKGLSPENLAKALGGIGVIPESLLSEEFKKILLDDVLSHGVDQLKKLDNRYLARIVFGLQNFQVTEASEKKLQESLELIADAYKNKQKKDPLALDEAEALSAGLQSFQSICLPELLKMIDVSLDRYSSSRNVEDAKHAVFIVKNLQGYGKSEDPHISSILKKAAAIIKNNATNLSPALIAQALVGLAAHAHKSETIQDSFNTLLQHQYSYLTTNTSEIITMREFIFACQLYHMRTDFTKYTKEIEALQKLIHQNCESRTVPLSDEGRKIKGIIYACINSAADLKRNFFWNESVECDYFWEDGALDIEINGNIHHIAAERERDELRKELLKHHRIGVIELDFGGLEAEDQKGRKRVWNKFWDDVKAKYEATRY